MPVRKSERYRGKVRKLDFVRMLMLYRLGCQYNYSIYSFFSENIPLFQRKTVKMSFEALNYYKGLAALSAKINHSTEFGKLLRKHKRNNFKEQCHSPACTMMLLILLLIFHFSFHFIGSLRCFRPVLKLQLFLLFEVAFAFSRFAKTCP